MSEVITNGNTYDDDSIRSLKGAERIRKRPAAVLGSDGLAGAFHTVTEIIGNSMDEIRAGYGDLVKVTYHKDGSITVEDTGRGVPMGWNENEGRWNWDLIFNELYAGGKYDDDNPNYEFSLGLNGLGAASTQYSSAFFTVISKRADKIYKKSFLEGNPINVTEDGAPEEEPNTTGETGTIVHWKADDKVFTSTAFTAAMFKESLESQAHLNKVTVTFTDENTGEHVVYEGKGIVEYLKEKLGDTVIDILEKEATSEGVENGKKYKSKIEVVLAITEESTSRYLHHHNTAKMKTGVHQLAFDEAITSFFKTIGKQNNVTIIPYDYNGYLSVLTSTFANANATSFANQTKDGVDNEYIYRLVYSTIVDMLEEGLATNRSSITTLVQNVVNSATARQQAKELEQQQRLALRAQGRRREKAEKFVDCKEKDPAKRELFIVEGDSALGSCEEARDSKFQALLPLKGKPMNGLKAKIEDLLKNSEVRDIINTLGCGVDLSNGVSTYDESKLQFSKIIITTDADIDGNQIRVLVYTIFYRLFPKLLEKGYVYVAETPLFELVMSNKESWFAYSIEERDQLIEKAKNERLMVKKINRSKGLGQNNPDMMWETTMNPETRRLVPLKIDTNDEIVRDVSNMLFGEDVNKERKGFVYSLLEKKLGEDVVLNDLVDTVNALEQDDLDGEEVEEVINQ